MNTRKVAIILTIWIGLSILCGVGMAGTYIYHDENGKEVRELPKSVRIRSEEGGRADGPGPRKSAERRAGLVVEVESGTPSGVQR